MKEDSSKDVAPDGYGESAGWQPQSPRITLRYLLLAWLVTASSVLIAAAIIPGVSIGSVGGALVSSPLIALLNAVLPPVVAALRVPFTLVFGFLAVLAVNAINLLLVSSIAPGAIRVDGFGWALLAALVISAAMIALDAILGANDDQTYALRVVRRIASRQGRRQTTDVPGIVFLEIDGLALPVLQRAMRDGTTPELARWVQSGSHQLREWETDLSSQTGASQAGILLGSNEDVPAFRWIDKETGSLVTCSSPADCAEIERRLASGGGLLVGDGASRGNLFSGEAEAAILTVSRISAEKRANPGYRAFLANGFNVTRLLVLFWWEVIIERVAAVQQRRRDVRPRGDRGGRYPLMRAAMCVGVRDLIVFGVLGDMMQGRSAVYATFSSYDEVAHHSGLERADTLEALRKLDQQFGRINRARRFAPRPYKLVVLSDHGQTQGATFKQRNGYDLHDLVQRSLKEASIARLGSGDENDAAVGHAIREATGRSDAPPARGRVDEQVAVLASGNLGLIYLLATPQRLTLEEINESHPNLVPALRDHPHIGLVLVHSREHGPVVLGAHGTHYLGEARVVGEDPLARFSPNAAAHLTRAAGFAHAADITVNSFYDPGLEQGCAFEELISFHGGLGGPQTRPFILHPVDLSVAAEPLVGAASVHRLLTEWRRVLQANQPVASKARPVTAA